MTIVNLATYRQFTIGCLRLNHSKNLKKKSKLHQVWAVPILISATKDVICCSDGYIYLFFGLYCCFSQCQCHSSCLRT